MIELSTGIRADLADSTAMVTPFPGETRSKEISFETLPDTDTVFISDEARSAVEKLASARNPESQTDRQDSDAAFENAVKIITEHKVPTTSGESSTDLWFGDGVNKQLRNAMFAAFIGEYSSLYTKEELNEYTQRIKSVGGDASKVSYDLFSKDEIADGLDRVKAFQKKKVDEYLQHNQTSFSGVTERGTEFTINLEVTEDHLSFKGYTMNFTRKDGTTESFDLKNGGGFRELEDGTIVQFGKGGRFTFDSGRTVNALIGTEGQDILVYDDAQGGLGYIGGGGGNDIVILLQKQDGLVVDGGDGNDTIFISENKSLYYKSYGTGVRVYGGNGDDTITYQGKVGGDSFIYGGDGDDKITIEGNGIAYGSFVHGGEGNDEIRIRSSGDIGISGSLIGGGGNDVISISGGNIYASLGKIEGNAGNDFIQLKGDGKIAVGNIEGGAGNDRISIEGDEISQTFGNIDGGAGSDSITLKGNKIIAQYMLINGGEDFDKIQLDAKIIKLMDTYINGGGGGDLVEMSGSDITLERTYITGVGDGSASIKADNISIRGGRFDNRTSISSRKASIKYSGIFGDTLRHTGH